MVSHILVDTIPEAMAMQNVDATTGPDEESRGGSWRKKCIMPVPRKGVKSAGHYRELRSNELGGPRGIVV